MRIKHITFLISLFLLIIFTSCAKKLPHPTTDYDNNVIIIDKIDGYYENKLGKKHNIVINQFEYEKTYPLLIWAKNNYKSICISQLICLVDTSGNGYFSHSAILGREALFPLNNPVQYFYTIKNSDTISIPSLNTTSTKEIGETMYEKFNLYGDIKTKLNIKVNNVEFDKTYNLVWSKQGYKSICEKNICLLDTKNKSIFSHYIIKDSTEIFELENPFYYNQISDEVSQDSFRYIILYQGKIDNKIKISFREFKDDMARPAFTQDIEYQLSPNGTTTIGFKGLRINVIKATNVDITYSVVKDFN
ncbi:hypothetical protein [Aliarcobacter cryaerophilus]|uniref:hypothetical protein n=1 Tax=Aliarcobacter cryaerophilus TaxID=28198 RepID=UPI0008254066|nr:hypothetical protein [Aliarcobacter cryaerophilus]